VAGRIRSIEKIHLIGTRTHDLSACSIVPQPTTLPRSPVYTGRILISEVILEIKLIIFDTTAVKHFLLGVGFDSLVYSTYLPAILEIFITICTWLLTLQFVFHFTDGKPGSFRKITFLLLCAIATLRLP
jgi:hypothetical protein